MRKQITHIAPLQTAKVVAILHFIGSCALLVAMLLRRALWSFDGYGMGWGGGMHRGGRFMLAWPFVAAIMGFIVAFIGAWVYNYVAQWVGGIEITTADTPAASPGPK